MKPITDDVVHTLMQGIAKRESRSARQSGSAKIIKFTRGMAKQGDVISLDAARARKTISGVFCYVARLGSV